VTDVVLRTIVESSVRVALVAGAVALLLAALRVRASASRHAAWTAVLAAMLLMPGLPYLFVRGAIQIPPLLRDDGPASSRPVGSRALPPAAPPSSERSSAGQRGVPEVTTMPAQTVARERREFPWPALAISVYALGSLLMLVRLAFGWCAAARILRSGRRISPQSLPLSLPATPGEPPILESDLVAAPVTVGVLRPSVVLPAAWTSWPEPELRGILAHELAHVERRDLDVSFFAAINRCLYWFHPLAWWLERRLAESAELACDDAVLRAFGEPRRYAAILLQLAEAVRRSGGRVVRPGLGIDGGARVGRRIERVLDGKIASEPSLLRKSALAAGCAAAIFLVAACRPQSPPAPLRDPVRTGPTLEEVRRHDETSVRGQASHMSEAEYRELDGALKRGSADRLSVWKLLLADWARVTRSPLPQDAPAIVRRRAHVLWLIENHPEWPEVEYVEARLFPEGFGPLSDPRGHARAKERWIALVEPSDARSAVLKNAARFFESTDKSVAEALLMRGQRQNPRWDWSRHLGELYAAVWVGRYGIAPQQQRPIVVFAEPDSPFADSVRRKLDESTDPALLTQVALNSLYGSRRGTGPSIERDLATRWLERAVRLNPDAVRARSELVRLRYFLGVGRGISPLVNVAPADQYRVVAALPESERFAILGTLAVRNYRESESVAQYEDMKQIAARTRERAKRYADDLLELAPRFRSHPDYGAQVFKAYMVLGSLALREGDRSGAVRYMRRAARAPVSEELAYSESIVSWGLMKDLLVTGERESVIEFLEQMAQTNVVRRTNLQQWAADIRRGQMPAFDRRNYW
jgi:hypothetical protein